MGTMVSTSDLSKGIMLELDGRLFVLLDYQHFKLGKGNSEARVRLKLRDVRTGASSERTVHSGDRLPKAAVAKQTFQYLYRDGDLYYFMNSETFEQQVLDREQVGSAVHYLKEGMELEMLVYGEQPITVELPTTVKLKVAETSPGFRGDTVQGGMKPCQTETGLTVDVPLFVNEGDIIAVDTRTGAYVTRAG